MQWSKILDRSEYVCNISPEEMGYNFGKSEAEADEHWEEGQAERACAWWLQNQNLFDLSGINPEDLKQFKKGWIEGFKIACQLKQEEKHLLDRELQAIEALGK